MPRTTYRSMLFVVMGLLLCSSLGAAGLAQFAASRGEYFLTRIQLAHNVLEAYLELSSGANALFKRMADVTLAGDAGDEPAITQARQAVETALRRLRQGIAAEIAHVEAVAEQRVEAAELDRLAAVEREIARILDETRLVSRSLAEGRRAQARVEARLVLDRVAEQRLVQLIETAVDDETRQVAGVDSEAALLMNRVVWLARASAAGFIVIVAWACYWLLRRLRRPLGILDGGTRELARGNLDHRIDLKGGDEFSQLADQLNRMADEIGRQRAQLQGARDDLERQVESRTRELADANEALQRADRQRRGFLADISHELRTPLTVVRGEAEIVLRGEDKPAEDYKQTLRRIVEQTMLTTRLVDDLLFVARAETGEARMQLRAVGLRALLERACADASVLARDKGIVIETALGADDALVSGDAGRLRQLFIILLDNAIRYSRPDGVVRVMLGPSPGGFNARVADEGAGIAPEDLERVFERFYRAGNAARWHAEGTGLGLPVAKAIVDAHGGKIAIDSVLDQGTIVSVVLAASRSLRAIA